MNKLKSWLASVLNHNKAALTYIGVTVALAAGDQVQAGHLVVKDLVGVALVAGGTVLRSSIQGWLDKNLPAASTSTTPNV